MLGNILILATLILTGQSLRESNRTWLLAALPAILSVQLSYFNAVLVAAICCGGYAAPIFSGIWRRSIRPLAIGFTAALSLLFHVPIILSPNCIAGHIFNLRSVESPGSLPLPADNPQGWNAIGMFRGGADK